jgi:hypothetical protein
MNAQAQAVERAWPLHDRARPRQQGLGGVAPILPCVVTLAPWARETLAGRPVPTVSGYACIDTGTAHSVVDLDVMRALEIPPVGRRRAKAVHSTEIWTAPLYSATLIFPGSNVPDLTLADFIGAHLEWETDPEIPGKTIIALLGRAALTRFVMIYDGPTSSITLIRRL